MDGPRGAEAREVGPVTDPVAVVYEDRASALIGVKLLVLSLARCSPGLTVLLTVPGAPSVFQGWVAAQPNAMLSTPDLELRGWNVKPSLLLHHLSSGHASVMWLDSDVIATGDLRDRLRAEPPLALVATEDVWWGREQGTTSRTVAWGLTPGRLLPTTVNTALLRVGAEHGALLEQWHAMLATDEYQQAQRRPWNERPLHLWGDQEVLTALLGSEAWSGLDVRLLRRGRDIAQCYGPGAFSPRERASLRRRRQLPVLVHAMGRKPWAGPTATSGGWTARGPAWAESLHRQLSPYTWAADSYRAELPGELDWTRRRGVASWMARVTDDDPLLREMPLAVIDAGRMAGRRRAGDLRRRLRRWRRPRSGD